MNLCPLQTPRRKSPEESNLEKRGWGGEWVLRFLSNDQETPVQKGKIVKGEVGWCTI
jgi:hypothetical protein